MQNLRIEIILLERDKGMIARQDIVNLIWIFPFLRNSQFECPLTGITANKTLQL